MACNVICAEHIVQREILLINEINIANSIIKLTSFEGFKNKNDNKNIALDLANPLISCLWSHPTI